MVTRILRDQKIPVISFVANTGGLLGLCMGFRYFLGSVSFRYSISDDISDINNKKRQIGNTHREEARTEGTGTE
ncbi:MAG: hypothetical protein ACK55Z_23970, partial [bacterium]